MSTVAERFRIAVQSHEAGRLKEAEDLYRAILRESPQQAETLHFLGVLTHQKGRHQEAIDLINRALDISGPEPVYYSNLASACLALGRFIEAASHCQEALWLRPDFADAHHNLGLALRGQGQLEEAVRAFRETLRLNPTHADAHCNLGATLHRLGKLPEALAHLEESVRLAPQNAQARNNLGGVLLACNLYQQAVPHLREAIRLQPNRAASHSNLGIALDSLNQQDEAILCFHEALRLDPQYATAHNNLGSVLKNLGRLDEAVAEFHEALRLDPGNVTAFFNLSRLAAVGRYEFREEEVAKLRDLATLPELSDDSRCRVHFTLGHVFDRNRMFDEAFQHYRQANGLLKEIHRQRGVSFDSAELRQHVNKLIAFFTPAYFEEVRDFGLDSNLPVFIIGMPRTGTSLVEQILASHPNIYGAGELAEVNQLIVTLLERLGAGANVGFPACLAHLDKATAHALAADHVQRLQARGGTALRVTDKAPFNFFHLGLIAALFPQSRIIHCRRDPVDTCLSCYFQNFTEPYPFTLDLEHLGQYYREYERLMTHWSSVLPVPILDLHYEELTSAQEDVSRRLIAFCGLPWDERCLRFYDNPRVVRTFSSLQVHQPMHRGSVGRWKNYEAHLQPLLDALQSSVTR